MSRLDSVSETARGTFRAGTSGWTYGWTNFYPKTLVNRDALLYYSRRFDTVEVNTSSYRLPKPLTYDRWRDETPAEFCFALKLSRYVTHVKRLRYASRYGAAGLRPWAGRIARWLGEGSDVYAHFNNDSGGHAPVDARTPRRLVESRAS